MDWKRNQIEEAISAMYASPSDKAESELRTRIKRLLEWDRAQGRKPRSDRSEEANYAFFSDDAPGSGADIWFSEYEAFALLNALQITDHGWPRAFAVSLMRQVRPELEKEHARILRKDPRSLFDQRKIRDKAEPGDFAVDNTDPVFLVLISRRLSESEAEEVVPTWSVCHGTSEAQTFIRKAKAKSMTLIEMVTDAHRLAEELRKTEPRHRGR